MNQTQSNSESLDESLIFPAPDDLGSSQVLSSLFAAGYSLGQPPHRKNPFGTKAAAKKKKGCDRHVCQNGIMEMSWMSQLWFSISDNGLTGLSTNGYLLVN